MVKVLIVSKNKKDVQEVIDSQRKFPDIDSVEWVSSEELPENFDGIIFCDDRFLEIELEKLNPDANIHGMNSVD
jgi:hypothetical protein